MNDLPARFTIERISAPSSPRRYLGIDNDGDLGWFSGRAPFSVFETEGAAKAFRRFRMRGHASDARVVRHTVH